MCRLTQGLCWLLKGMLSVSRGSPRCKLAHDCNGVRTLQVPSLEEAPAVLEDAVKTLPPSVFANYAMGEHACNLIDQALCILGCTWQPFMSAIMCHCRVRSVPSALSLCMQIRRGSMASAAAGRATISSASSVHRVLEMRMRSRHFGSTAGEVRLPSPYRLRDGVPKYSESSFRKAVHLYLLL